VSQENVEVALRGIEAFNRHDAQALQALCTPDVEWVPLRAALEGTSYRGPNAVSQMFADFDESWESLRFDHDEIHDFGDRILITGRLRAMGRATGVDLDTALSVVMRFRDGRLASFRSYTDASEARAAAGVAE
jgi:ketosteroid isomerase-like protein